MPMRPEDFPVRITVRNASATVANIHRLDADILEALQDAVTIHAGYTARRIKELCRKDTYYMHDHVRAPVSRGGLAFSAGWWREDFIGRQDYHGKRLKTFYPFYVEEGWHDETGEFHAGDHVIDTVAAQMQPRILADVREAIVRQAERAASRGGRR